MGRIPPACNDQLDAASRMNRHRQPKIAACEADTEGAERLGVQALRDIVESLAVLRDLLLR